MRVFDLLDSEETVMQQQITELTFENEFTVNIRGVVHTIRCEIVGGGIDGFVLDADGTTIKFDPRMNLVSKQVGNLRWMLTKEVREEVQDALETILIIADMKRIEEIVLKNHRHLKLVS
ncbi:hypothetical protein ACFL2V_18400 [Pseudomonadota bacterium]